MHGHASVVKHKHTHTVEMQPSMLTMQLLPVQTYVILQTVPVFSQLNVTTKCKVSFMTDITNGVQPLEGAMIQSIENHIYHRGKAHCMT